MEDSREPTGAVHIHGTGPVQKLGSRCLPLTLIVGDYDRTRPLLDGRVQVDGIDLNARSGQIGDFCLRPVYEEYDVAEMSLSWYIMARCRREPVIALPVFPLRMFVHPYIFCRSDAAYAHPKDLVGRRVGIPRYRLTVALWIRGILKEYYDVAPENLLWVTTAEEGAGFRLPPDVSVTRLAGANVEELLLRGEVDALFSAVIPDAFRRGDPRIRRLFPDCRTEVEGYFRSTQIFPITHTIVMGESLYRRAPWVAERLVAAFREAHKQCEDFYLADPKHLTLPRAVFILEEERATFGADLWSHGVSPNRHVLETFVRYAHEQGYIPEPLSLDQLFPDNTLAL